MYNCCDDTVHYQRRKCSTLPAAGVQPERYIQQQKRLLIPCEQYHAIPAALIIYSLSHTNRHTRLEPKFQIVIIHSHFFKQFHQMLYVPISQCRIWSMFNLLLPIILLTICVGLDHWIGSKSEAPCLHRGQTKSSGNSLPSCTYPHTLQTQPFFPSVSGCGLT